MILLYIYLIVLILLYVFLQLNYLFAWFELPMKVGLNNAGLSIAFGLLFCIFWPVTILVCLVVKLALYMDDIHNKHKNK